MPDETLEGWLEREMKDAENTWGMYRSYRQEENVGGVIALTRLRALKDVSDKIAELWGSREEGKSR